MLIDNNFAPSLLAHYLRRGGSTISHFTINYFRHASKQISHATASIVSMKDLRYSDVEIINDFINGDAEDRMFAYLFQADAICRIVGTNVNKYSRNRNKYAEYFNDIRADALLGLKKTIQKPGFKLEKSLLALFNIICQNKANDYFDREYKKNKLFDPIEGLNPAINNLKQSGLDNIEELVVALINALPQYCRELLSAYYLKAVSYKELSDLFKKSEIALRKDVSRCKENLEDLIEGAF
jgi:RNA polymerase sigma factor (sigma-70 family)